MKTIYFAPALLVLALSTGCATPTVAVAASPAPEVGEQVTMSGKLVIKGSMPMLQAVLTRETGERWELKGIQPLTAARLQNKRVLVEGKVVRAKASPMLLPSLTLTNITLNQ